MNSKDPITLKLAQGDAKSNQILAFQDYDVCEIPHRPPPQFSGQSATHMVGFFPQTVGDKLGLAKDVDSSTPRRRLRTSHREDER